MSRPFHKLLAPQQAGILCNDPAFQRFAATRQGWPGQQFNNSASAEYLRQVCGIASRRDLKDNAKARDRFDRLKTDFDAWAGRIAKPQNAGVHDERP